MCTVPAYPLEDTRTSRPASNFDNFRGDRGPASGACVALTSVTSRAPTSVFETYRLHIWNLPPPSGNRIAVLGRPWSWDAPGRAGTTGVPEPRNGTGTRIGSGTRVVLERPRCWNAGTVLERETGPGTRGWYWNALGVGTRERYWNAKLVLERGGGTGTPSVLERGNVTGTRNWSWNHAGRFWNANGAGTRPTQPSTAAPACVTRHPRC